MKKLAVAAAVLSCSISFGMVKTTLDKFNAFVSEWSEELTAPVSAERIERDWDEFSTAPFKEKLQEEIGDDSLAQEAFKLFQGRDFVGLWNLWKEHNKTMSADNAGKFLDILILLAPILNEKESDRPIVKELVHIAGGGKSACNYVPQFQQFSYEMFFCLMVDSMWGSKSYDEFLSQMCEGICGNIGCTKNDSWPSREKELSLRLIVGCREDDTNLCSFRFSAMWENEESSEK
jgi:hypothetical protein